LVLLGCSPCMLSASSQVSFERPAVPSFPTRRSSDLGGAEGAGDRCPAGRRDRRAAAADQDRVEKIHATAAETVQARNRAAKARGDRKSTRLNSSHVSSSYAVFCLKKKTMICNILPNN